MGNKKKSAFLQKNSQLLIPLIARKDSQFCRYHLNQGIILFFIYFLINLLSAYIGVLGLLSIGTLILMVMGLVNCYKGVCAPLPLIGNFQILK